MRARGKRGWWTGILLCSAAACGQELVLPHGKPVNVAGAPSEGFTGASGAPDAPPSPRLPVAKDPVFTSFGGAGGDPSPDGNANDEAPPPSSNGGAGGSSSTTAKPAGGAAGSGGAIAGGGAAGRAAANVGGALAGASGVAGGDERGGAASDMSNPAALLFSEYVEGSGSFKALEIY